MSHNRRTKDWLMLLRLFRGSGGVIRHARHYVRLGLYAYLVACCLFLSVPTKGLAQEKKCTEALLRDLSVAMVNCAGNCSVAPTNVAQAESTNNELTPREQLAQLLMVGVSEADVAIQLQKKYSFGGIFIPTKAPTLYQKEKLSELKKAGKAPPLIAVDQEGGQVERLDSVIGSYPSAKELGAKSNEEVERLSKEMATKLAALGITVNFAPVLDVDDGSNSIISKVGRAFSANPAVIAEKANAFAKGQRDGGVAPVFKHFPGHGRADGDSHLKPVSTPDLAQLRELDLKPYEQIADKGVAGVMVGHLIVPGLTDGTQATISKPAVDLLRNDYRFNGVVFSDDIAQMEAILQNRTVEEAVSLAIQAGIDMATLNLAGSARYANPEATIDKILSRLEADLAAGVLKQEDIDESIGRISQMRRIETDAVQAAEAESGCPPVCGTTELSGSENAEKIWNYLISKGLSAPQTAGIMGNIQHESGFKPDINEKRPIVKGSRGGYGIVQWTAGRRVALEKAAATKGVPVSDLGFQLDYLWYELNGPYKSNTLDPIMATQDLQQASNIFLFKFERPKNQGPEVQKKRGDAGRALLAQYGSNTAAGGAVSGVTCDTGSGAAANLPGGDAAQLARKLLDSPNVKSDNRNQLESIAAGQGPCPNVNGGRFTIDAELLRILVGLAEKHTYTMSSLHRGCTGSGVGAGSRSRHWRGKAVDISGSRPINGVTMGGSFANYDGSGKIQSFVNDAKLLLKANCELGVPNDQYKKAALAQSSPCTNVFLDTPGTTGATGPHVHIGVP